MNLDERVRSAARELNEVAVASVDRGQRFDDLLDARKRQTRARGIASVAAAIIVVGVLSIAALNWDTQSAAPPLEGPEPTRTLDTSRLLECGPGLSQPCPRGGGDFYMYLDDTGSSRLYTAENSYASRLDFVLPQSGWVVAEAHDYSLELAVTAPGSKTPTDTGIAIFGRPVWGDGLYYAPRFDTSPKKIIERVAAMRQFAHPPGPTVVEERFAGIDGWRTDISLPVNSATSANCRNALVGSRTRGEQRCVAVLRPNYMTTRYGLAPGAVATVIVVKTPTDFPLVVWVAGDPEILEARSEEVQAVLETMTLAPIDP